jgi:hypothetical protein
MKPRAWWRLLNEPQATTVIDVPPVGMMDETVRVVVYMRDTHHGMASLAALPLQRSCKEWSKVACSVRRIRTAISNMSGSRQ